ncbi:hypothetical protein Tco_0121193 [Tanacetum coccineum]
MKIPSNSGYTSNSIEGRMISNYRDSIVLCSILSALRRSGQDAQLCVLVSFSRTVFICSIEENCLCKVARYNSPTQLGWFLWSWLLWTGFNECISSRLNHKVMVSPMSKILSLHDNYEQLLRLFTMVLRQFGLVLMLFLPCPHTAHWDFALRLGFGVRVPGSLSEKKMGGCDGWVEGWMGWDMVGLEGNREGERGVAKQEAEEKSRRVGLGREV